MATGGEGRVIARRMIPAVVVLLALLAGCTAVAPAPTVADLAARPVWTRVDPIQDYAVDRLSTMTLDERIRSMFMVHLAGTNAGALSSYASGSGAAGLILMGDNIPQPEGALAGISEQLTAAGRGLPMLLAIDQEGGIVRRLFSDEAASAEQLRGLPASAATEAFAARAALLASVGVSVNFGVVADVTGDPASFIFDRSMGSTPATAAERVAAAVAGEQGVVLSTLKHFPGHGVAPGDSHSSIPATGMGLDQWRAEHVEPFRAGIGAGAEFVMVGHLQFDAVDPQPATLSGVWHDILRDELGFDGIIVTDDMGMLQNSGRPDLADPASNAVRAIAAGATLLLYVGPVDLAAMSAAVQAAVAEGTISVDQIDDAAQRLLELRRALSGESGPFVHCFTECQAIIR